MRLTAAVAGSLLFALPAAAGAADAPNLVGNWTRTAFSAAQIGEHAGYAPVTKPSLMHGDAQDWTMKIDAQDGGSFSGTLTGPSGRPQAILGTFQRDGKHFVFATVDDMGNGTVENDELEYCWATSSQRFVGTGCATYKRAK
jgi:hypothetical protein